MSTICVLLVLAFVPAAAQTPAAVEPLPLAIVLKPLFAQGVQMLDVALINPAGLLVLDRTGVTRYELDEALSSGETTPRWRKIESIALPSRTWPRDVRGHLLMDSGRFHVFLPGTDCTAQFGPLRMNCFERRVPWPLSEVPNGGLEPGRNYFTTPEGMTVYGGAIIATDGEGFIVADSQGRLTQLDVNRRPVADLGAGDDVVPLRAIRPCPRAGSYYLAASHRPDGDVLRVFVVERGRFVPATPDFPLPGAFTALSSVEGKTFVITRLSGADRYDAFQADISCGR